MFGGSKTHRARATHRFRRKDSVGYQDIHALRKPEIQKKISEKKKSRPKGGQGEKNRVTLGLRLENTISVNFSIRQENSTAKKIAGLKGPKALGGGIEKGENDSGNADRPGGRI